MNLRPYLFFESVSEPLAPSQFSRPSVLAVHDLDGEYHIRLSISLHDCVPPWALIHHFYSPLCYCNSDLPQALQMDELLPTPVSNNQNDGEPTVDVVTVSSPPDVVDR
jgi:hypothetical protein